MTTPPRHAAALALLLALNAAPTVQAAPAADTPANYAAHWPLQLPADASLIRLPLTAEVLTQAQTADLRDLRVFNAAGQPVPLAVDRFSPETRAPAPTAAPITLPALPILGEPQPGNASGGMALRIEENADGRVVRLDLPPASAARKEVPTDATTGPLAGALIDTRGQTAALQAIELDATWPPARPFTFRLHASTDLRHWQPLGEVTAYRGGDGNDTVTAPARVELAGVNLQARYLRVTWDATPTAAPGAVQVRAIHLLPVAAQAAPARLAVPLALPDAGRDPHALEWRLPFATPVVALDIRADGPATLVPVRILVRQQREQPWTLLARHVVFNLTQDGHTQHSPTLELGQTASRGAWREWRVEAEPSSPGFPATPQVTAWLAPAQLVFMASGQPPYTLTTGRADAPATSLPLASLIPGYEPGAQTRLPAATLITGPADTAVPITTTAPGTQYDSRQWTLWAVLLAAVLALGGMAWVLIRQLNKGQSDLTAL
ncbi:DUF3999 domain-containing protein [Azonexus sp.]|jgi:hypothetical protein|uniref:DUF3999 domain-containing protein n=1 Tax=Azonexus sp. TaxID=1872668 RepID=UPI002819B0AD|nr:DUF3999 domain-containing protein [Azonexus sp.]MDR1994386.1 DUF3999 domain-containing protein [Azonexus sp.]